ncbi:MAG TPA: hypothetical protein VEI02_00895, partial [Planctomycetota bacterium]|nr:hypothetical protein [Planctomycetota bacterium]
MTRRARADRGVAFILVLGVLAGLLILAGPFLAIALNDRDVARSVVYEAEATAVVDTTLRYARWSLERGHRAHEAAAGQPTSGDIYATPDWDVEQEFAVSLAPTDKNGKPLLAADGAPLLGGADPRGRMVDLEVRDAQSRPHLWTSSPFLIAASLGRSVLVADAEADAVELQLESGEGFPLTNGALFVEGERITYEKREGGLFLGLGRAAPPSGKARKHKAETWVIDDRARQIAMLPWKSPRAKGGLRQPHAASAAKEISLVEGGLLTPREIDRLSRDFNTASYRYGGDAFGMAHGLTAPIDPSTVDLAEGFRIRIRGNDGINEGTVLRITDGVNTEYGYVIQARRSRGSNADITLLEPTQNAYVEGRTMVAPLIRHPVNVNACSKETLKRVMTGVQITFGAFGRGSQLRVSEIAAGTFADGLIDARPIKEWKQFVETLDATQKSWTPLIPDASAVQCVLRNAVDAGDH